MAFVWSYFEEGSNLAMLSKNYKIPNDNPYGDGLVELINRMLTDDWVDRSDMKEVILCLSALYSKKPLPPKRKSRKSKTNNEMELEGKRVGSFRTDGQGIHFLAHSPKKPVEAKKLNPNSAAARRKNALRKTPVPKFVSNLFDKEQNNTTPSQKSNPSSRDLLSQLNATKISESSENLGFEANFVDSSFHSFGNIDGAAFSKSENPFSSTANSEQAITKGFDDFSLPKKELLSSENTTSMFSSNDAFSSPVTWERKPPTLLPPIDTTDGFSNRDINFQAHQSFSKLDSSHWDDNSFKNEEQRFPYPENKSGYISPQRNVHPTQNELTHKKNGQAEFNHNERYFTSSARVGHGTKISTSAKKKLSFHAFQKNQFKSNGDFADSEEQNCIHSLKSVSCSEDSVNSEKENGLRLYPSKTF